MDGYELHGHLSEQLFSAIVDCFANFSSSVGSVSEEIYSLTGRLFFLYLSVTALVLLVGIRPGIQRFFEHRP